MEDKINYFNVIRNSLASFLLGYIIGKDMLPPIL
tara:strand:- start:695 stop:796 length:102 start_codon:yes stop_codon:yes gene_type:complete